MQRKSYEGKSGEYSFSMFAAVKSGVFDRGKQDERFYRLSTHLGQLGYRSLLRHALEQAGQADEVRRAC